MTKRKIAAWIVLPVVYASFFGMLALVLEAVPERPSPSTPVEEVFKPDPVALEPDLNCVALPSWRPYSTLPLVYHPPCGFGEMIRAAASTATPAEALEQARAENTALHERLREMAEYEARAR